MRINWDRYLRKQLKNPRVKRAFDQEWGALAIGVALAQERQKLGLTQEHVAERMGTSAPQLSRTERQPEHANISTLMRYADALDLKLDFVLRPKRKAAVGGQVQWSGRRLGTTKSMARLRGKRTVAEIVVENRE
jgi:transcriptional regulator with XRE-family HTH domain